MKLTNVTMHWADGEVTTESFRSEEEFFKYLDMMNRDGYEVDEFCSDNINWNF